MKNSLQQMMVLDHLDVHMQKWKKEESRYRPYTLHKKITQNEAQEVPIVALWKPIWLGTVKFQVQSLASFRVKDLLLPSAVV